jgi:predicted nucleic acid-binding protein
MILVDTSAFLSLAIGDALHVVLDEFDAHTTETVVDELDATADYDDRHGAAAETVLQHADRITVHSVSDPIQSSRIDAGEGSCAVLATETGAEFLLTDDLRALPELQSATTAQVALSPIVLKALVERDALTRPEAVRRLEAIAETRDWLGAPIYRRARRLFDTS